MRRILLVLGIAATAVGGGGGMVGAPAFGAGEVGAFGSGTLLWSTGPAAITVNATNTGDGVTATGTIHFTYSSAGVTYNTTANVLCVRNVGGLILVGSVVTDTNLPAGPGPGLVIVIQDNGQSGPDRVGTGFEPAPVTSQTSNCEVSPTIFPLSTLSSGDFTSTNVPAAASPPTTTTTTMAAAPRPVIAGPKVAPTPRAGLSVLVSFQVTRSDSGAGLNGGKVTFTPSVGGKVLRHTEQVRGDTVSLRVALPQASRGETLKIRLTVELGTQSSTRVVTFRIG